MNTKLKAGIMVSEIAFANFPVIFRAAGLDYFILDCEHGGYDYADISRMIMTARLSGTEVVVRLSGNERKDIVKYMDMGADGVLLPMTNNAEDIARVVKFAKYRPIGERGISTMRAHTFYDPPAILSYTQQANARTKVFAQIETKQGVENLREILSVEGVTGCFVGPNDLSDDYGCLGQDGAPRILDAIGAAGKAAEELGKVAGIITGSAVYIAEAKKCGFTLFCKGSELNAVKEYCKGVVRDIRS